MKQKDYLSYNTGSLSYANISLSSILLNQLFFYTFENLRTYHLTGTMRFACLLSFVFSLAHAAVYACAPATINWTGNVNNDWNNAANYSAAPANSIRVVIDPANYTGAAASPVIAVNSNYNPNWVTVQNGANLTIQANLTLQENLFAQPDFTVNNATSQVNMSAGVVDITYWGAKRDLNLQNAAGFTATGGSVNARDVNINTTTQYNVTTATVDLTRDLNINGTLNFNSGNVYLERDFANNGTYSQSGGLVTFDGTGNQDIDGSSAFTDMTVNNSGSNVTLNTGTHSISGTLTLTNGTFVTNNAITLLSTGSGTARIAEITGGAITGNITMERYIDGSYGWKLLGSAVGGQTLGDWDDDIYMSGVNGIDGNACCPIWYSVYTYDETLLGPFQDRDRKSTRLNSSHIPLSRMPSSA